LERGKRERERVDKRIRESEIETKRNDKNANDRIL